MTDQAKTASAKKPLPKNSEKPEVKTLGFSLQEGEQAEVSEKLDTLLERLRSNPAYRGIRLSPSAVSRMAFMRGLDAMLQEVR